MRDEICIHIVLDVSAYHTRLYVEHRDTPTVYIPKASPTGNQSDKRDYDLLNQVTCTYSWDAWNSFPW